MTNSTDFSKLKPNQELYMIRYSQKDNPDYIPISFKYCDKKTTESTIEFEYHTNSKVITKKVPMRKAEFRIFIDIDEMARVLYDCFHKRGVELIPKYEALFDQSQTNKPEIWI